MPTTTTRRGSSAAKPKAPQKHDPALYREGLLLQIPGYDPITTAGDAWFEPEIAEKMLDFFPRFLRHIEGRLARQPFILEPWQQAIVANLFGWQRLDARGDQVRRYRELFLYVARKNGKTPLCAGIGLAVLFCDDEIGQQDYIGAGDREQAGKLFRYAKGMIDQAPALSSQCRIYGGNATAGQSRSVVIEEEASFLRIVASDAETAHGDTTHLAIIDELHVQPNRSFFDTVSTSFASENRKQPLFIQLTTADYDRPSVCNDQYKIACAVRDGRLNKPEFLPVIYEAPQKLHTDDEEDLDYTDPAVYGNETIWAMANPNLDVSVSRAHLRNQVKTIQETPSSLYEFLRLHLNVRTRNVSTWLNMQKWDASAGAVAPAALRGRSCYGGLDLGATSDLTSLCLTFPPEEGEAAYTALWWNWVPEETAKARARRGDTAYMDAIARGELLTTEGDEIDYAVIRQTINALGETYGILEMAVDRLFQGVECCQNLVKDGFNVVPFGQGFLSMAGPTKEFERLIGRGEFHHGGNGLVRWAAGNGVVRRDPAGNLKPDKEKSADKIDPIVAAIMALGRAMERHGAPTSIYETRGLISV